MYDPNKYKRDCFFFHERQEMGMTEPQCWLWKRIGIDSDQCACEGNPKGCPYFMSRNDVENAAVSGVLAHVSDKFAKEVRRELDECSDS